ncbi:MAG TPA: hypothetical protein VFS54_12805 [Solirubrobacterales bacterium]|nr:hypothetical protein [Solirubrobacterales bacterium]
MKLLFLLLVLVLVNSLLHREEEPLDLNPVAAAAERTREEPGARFTMEATYTSTALPRPMSAHGGGAYNSETGLSEARLTMDSPIAGRIEIEAVGDGTSFYMRGNPISSELPGGKEWMKVEPFLGHSQEEAMLGSDAASSLQMLSSASGVQRVGREKVRGVPTRRFRAEVGLDEYGALLREEGKDDLAEQYEEYATLMPTPPLVEVWIDSQGIVRRNRMVMTMPTEPGQPSLQMDMRMDLYDFGAQPAIQLPDDSAVFDMTPVVEEQLDALAEQ